LAREWSCTADGAGGYLRADQPDDLPARAAAVALVLPHGASLCRTTAAWLYGVDARSPGTQATTPDVECVVAPGRQPLRRPGLRCWTASLIPDDVQFIEGLPVTTPQRTALDCARYLSPGNGAGNGGCVGPPRPGAR